MPLSQDLNKIYTPIDRFPFLNIAKEENFCSTLLSSVTEVCVLKLMKEKRTGGKTVYFHVQPPYAQEDCSVMGTERGVWNLGLIYHLSR